MRFWKKLTLKLVYISACNHDGDKFCFSGTCGTEQRTGNPNILTREKLFGFSAFPSTPSWWPSATPKSTFSGVNFTTNVLVTVSKSLSVTIKFFCLELPLIFFFWIDLSLDIEGAEWPVLQTIPWDKVNIRVLIIEINHLGTIFEGNRFQVRKFLKENGYKVHSSTDLDEIYVKRKF